MVILVAVAILVGVVISPRLGAPEWALGAAGLGAAKIGMDGLGTEGLGTAKIGMDAIGAVAIGTAIGTVITVTIMLSSSETSASPGGGAGVGVLPGVTRITDTDMAIRTVTTATVMDMDIPATDTAIMGTETVMEMDMATGTVASIAPLPGRE